jgi:hypothetical protein
MEQVTLILAALAAGASAGTLDTLKDDVREKARASHGFAVESAARTLGEYGPEASPGSAA